MKVAILTLFSVLCCSLFVRAQDSTKSVRILDAYHGAENRSLAEGFANQFSVASKEEALKKLADLKASGAETTVMDFLGGDIKYIQLTFFDRSLTDFTKASTLLQEVLDWVILSPKYPEGPGLQVYWAEGSRPLVKALIVYANGRIGRIETDGSHLFFEDAAGTYWWYRGDSSVRRKQLK